LFLLYSSNLLVVYQAFRFKFEIKSLSNQLLVWLSIRFLSEVLCYFVQFHLKGDLNQVFLISVLLEGISIIWFYHTISKKDKPIRWLYLVPIFLFYVDIKYPLSIYKVNGISFIVYNAISSLLMLKRIINLENIELFTWPIIIAMFIFHSLSFVYSMVEHLVRTDKVLMSILYPLFLLLIVSFNSYISYYLWSARKT
jgi:hypothetical protein